VSLSGSWIFELDRRTHRVTRDKKQVHPSTLDVRLLRFLMLAPGRVFSRAEILAGVRPSGIFVSLQTVDGDQHGPAAKAILSAATADDPQRGLEVRRAARQSIEAPIRLWDGLLTTLNYGEHASLTPS
jgi:hypothetical protein